MIRHFVEFLFGEKRCSLWDCVHLHVCQLNKKKKKKSIVYID